MGLGIMRANWIMFVIYTHMTKAGGFCIEVLNPNPTHWRSRFLNALRDTSQVTLFWLDRNKMCRLCTPAFINQPVTICSFLLVKLWPIMLSMHSQTGKAMGFSMHLSRPSICQDYPSYVHFYLPSVSADKAFPMHSNPWEGINSEGWWGQEWEEMG